MTRSASSLTLLVAALVLSGCASDSLSERDARSVKVGDVLATSYTAAVRGTQSHVMLPSGRVDLTLTTPVDEIPAQDAAAAVPLRPTGDAKAVAVAWSLNRGAYPDDLNRQLAPPKTIFGVPKPVRLWLVTDDTRREIKNVATLEIPRSRPRNAAWVVVPSGVRQWRFEVEYAGVTQRVDARSGKVTPGVAAPLYRPIPLNYRGSCEFASSGYNYSSCGLEFAVGFPYVDGAGWAPNGKSYAVLSVSAAPDTDASQNVLVAGVRPAAVLNDDGKQFRAYVVTPARTYPVTGSAPTDDEDGKITSVPLTGTLATDRTAP